LTVYLRYEAGEIVDLFPGLEEFKATVKEVDPNGMFINDFATDLLGL